MTRAGRDDVASAGFERRWPPITELRWKNILKKTPNKTRCKNHENQKQSRKNNTFLFWQRLSQKFAKLHNS